jgi:hypothetical protein
MNPGSDLTLFQEALCDLADAVEALGVWFPFVLGNTLQVPFHSLSIFSTEEAADPRSQR